MFLVRAVIVLLICFPIHLNCEKCLERFLVDKPILYFYNNRHLDVFGNSSYNPKILVNLDHFPNLNVFDDNVDQPINYIVLVNDSMQINETLSKIFTWTQWHPQSKHLIATKELFDENKAKSALKILWDNDVYNAAIVSLNNFQGFTWYPFNAKNKCGFFINLKSLNACSSFDPFANKFPRKLFKKCPVKISWYPSEIVVKSPYEPKNPGVFIELVFWIENRLGITPVYEKGLALRNVIHKEVSIEDEVDHKKIDVILNVLLYLFVSDMGNNLERSAPLFESERVWVMPQKKRIPAWCMFFNFFSFTMWMMLLIIFLILLVLWCFTRNSSISTSLIAITKLLLWQNVGKVNCLSKKIILACGSLFIIHFTLVFTSRLISTLTNPYLAQTAITLEDIAKMNVTLSYGPFESETLQQADFNLWKLLEMKREQEMFKNMTQDHLKYKLAHNLNNTAIIFSIDRVFLNHYVKNLEEIEIHPVPVLSFLILALT